MGAFGRIYNLAKGLWLVNSKPARPADPGLEAELEAARRAAAARAPATDRAPSSEAKPTPRPEPDEPPRAGPERDERGNIKKRL